MFALSCTGATLSDEYVYVYHTLNPGTPFAMLNGLVPALSDDGSILAIGDSSSTVTVYQLSMGSYTTVQSIPTGLMIDAVAMAPDASGLAVSDGYSKTMVYGWVSSQFLLAMTPLSVGYFTMSLSAQSSAGSTTIACAHPSGPNSPVYSLVNTMGSLSLTLQTSISGQFNGVAITPDGSTVAFIDNSATTVYSASTGASIATIAERGQSVGISSDAATVFVGDPIFNSLGGRAVWYDSNVAPTITLQPMSQSVSLGSTATFTAAATGYVSVQWSFTGSSTRRRAALGGAIAGAVSPSFTTNPTTLGFNGNTYSATFTSAAGLSTSSKPSSTMKIENEYDGVVTITRPTIRCLASGRPKSSPDIASTNTSRSTWTSPSIRRTA